MNDEEEIWVPLLRPGFENTHEISSLGRIRRLVPTKYISTVPYYLRYTMQNGQLLAKLYTDGIVTNCIVAKEVLRSFKVKKTAQSIVYKDKNPENVRLSNLGWGRYSKPVLKEKSSSEYEKGKNIEKSCSICLRYPLNRHLDSNVVPCNITGILKFKTNFAACGCKDFIQERKHE